MPGAVRRRGESLVTCRAAAPCTYELDRARMKYYYIIAGLSSKLKLQGCAVRQERTNDESGTLLVFGYLGVTVPAAS